MLVASIERMSLSICLTSYRQALRPPETASRRKIAANRRKCCCSRADGLARARTRRLGTRRWKLTGETAVSILLAPTTDEVAPVRLLII